jgi:hypothetical protein
MNLSHPYRTPPVPPGTILKPFKVGDKVKVFTTPWSPTNTHGCGHHELFNERIGIILYAFENSKVYQNSKFCGVHNLYHVKFSHCTYIAAVGINQLLLVERELDAF